MKAISKEIFQEKKELPQGDMKMERSRFPAKTAYSKSISLTVDMEPSLLKPPNLSADPLRMTHIM